MGLMVRWGAGRVQGAHYVGALGVSGCTICPFACVVLSVSTTLSVSYCHGTRCQVFSSSLFAVR